MRFPPDKSRPHRGLLSLLLLLYLIATCNAAKCPPGCTCNNGDPSANCTGGNLPLIPHILNPKLKILLFAHNKVKSIDKNQFEVYEHLRYVDMSSNEFDNLNDSEFHSLKELRTLILSENRIPRIQKVNFLRGNKLERLDLRKNLISQIEENAFANLTSLTELDLSQNRIKSLTPGMFRGLEKLLLLRLDDNELTKIPVKAITSLKLLASLHLSINGFGLIPSHAFMSMTSLLTLKLNLCNVTKIEDGAFMSLAGLITLELSSNNLIEVPSSALQDTPKLEVLILDANPISSLKAHDFRHVRNLKLFSLSGSEELRSVHPDTFSENRDIKSISLNQNTHLSYVDTRMFRSMTKLEVLSLRGNSLGTVEDGLVSWYKLKQVDLRYNPLVCNCTMEWLREMTAAQRNGSMKTPFGNETAQIKCQEPSSFRGRYISSLQPGSLRCSGGLHIALIVSISVVILFLGVLLVLLYRCQPRLQKFFKCRFGSKTASKEASFEKTYVYEDETSICHLQQRHPIRLIPVTEL